MSARALRRWLAIVALIAAAAVPAAAATGGTHTIATVYEAFSYHGVVIPHVTVDDGYCWGSSNVTPRVDAWRCFVGNTIFDPCFSSDFANNVVCPTPWNDTAVEINLTKPLPKASNRASPSLQLQPWAIQTASGANCVFASGATSRAHGTRLNYVCGAKLGLWGYPSRKSRTWTILSAPPTAKNVSHRTVILRAWM